MKRLFFLSVALGMLLVFNTSVFAQTTVGNIYSSTTWTASASPYIIPNSIVVFQGVVLTIEPGVTMKFADGAGIDFRGQLIAVGTADQPITFTSANASPTRGIYSGIKFTGYTGTPGTITNQLTLSYCNISYATNFIDLEQSCEGPFNVSNCYFFEDYWGIGNGPDCGTLTVEFSKFEGCLNGVVDGVVNGCYFINDTTGTSAHYVSNCKFIGNHTGTTAYKSLTNCEGYNNIIGAQLDERGGAVVTNNYFHDNQIGILLTDFAGAVFSGNKLCHNTIWNLQYSASYNANVSDNCFCLTDSLAIRATLCDGYVVPSYGLLSFNVDNSCVAGTTAVGKVEQTASYFKVYPNPTSEEVTIEFNYDNAHRYSAVIFDQLGRMVATAADVNSGTAKIALKGVPAGMYYYQFKDEMHILQSGKLVVQ